jgi:hypothetical protein
MLKYEMLTIYSWIYLKMYSYSCLNHIMKSVALDQCAIKINIEYLITLIFYSSKFRKYLCYVLSNMRVYIYIYIYIYIYTRMYIYTRTHGCMYTYIHSYIHIYIYICVHLWRYFCLINRYCHAMHVFFGLLIICLAAIGYGRWKWNIYNKYHCDKRDNL